MISCVPLEIAVLLFAASDWPNMARVFCVKLIFNAKFEKLRINTRLSLACPKKKNEISFFSFFHTLHAHTRRSAIYECCSSKKRQKKVSTQYAKCFTSISYNKFGHANNDAMILRFQQTFFVFQYEIPIFSTEFRFLTSFYDFRQ